MREPVVSDQNEDSKTIKIAVESHLPRNRLGKLLFLPHTRYQERTPSLKVGTGPGKPKTKRTHRVGVGAPYPS